MSFDTFLRQVLATDITTINVDRITTYYDVYEDPYDIVTDWAAFPVSSVRELAHDFQSIFHPTNIVVHIEHAEASAYIAKGEVVEVAGTAYRKSTLSSSVINLWTTAYMNPVGALPQSVLDAVTAGFLDATPISAATATATQGSLGASREGPVAIKTPSATSLDVDPFSRTWL